MSLPLAIRHSFLLRHSFVICSPGRSFLAATGHLSFVILFAFLASLHSHASTVSTPFGTSYQVNVNASGQNIVGDAANEPSLCIDPNNPNRIAIGWRQFNFITNNFRQAGWGYSTNGGVTWTFGGTLETNVFRSDPVLASDAEGRFYFLSLQQNPFRSDLWSSTNGGANWQLLGPAYGGDKGWMTIDKTAGAGHGNIYQAWDNASITSNRDFSISYDGGLGWTNPFVIPQEPEWGTLDVGPEGQVYLLAWVSASDTFWLNRATNAPNRSVPFNFDLTVPVDFGGGLHYFLGYGPNPGGLLGQPWVAVDRSTNQTRGNVYALFSTGRTPNSCDVMFTRSTNGGANWSPPQQLNSDTSSNAWHWFGTLSVAPNGRIDACWYDSRHDSGLDTNHIFSELFYCYSLDGGSSWATNRAISPPFDSLIGWPDQNKIGDYIGMISLEDAACIAYSATLNGEQDIYYIRVEQPIFATISQTGAAISVSWNAVLGKTYCLQHKDSLDVPWPVATNQVCLVATNVLMSVPDTAGPGPSERFYRVVKQP